VLIELEHVNTSGYDALFLGTRQRLACCTAVQFIDEERMLVLSCVGQRMYLVRFDLDAGTHRIEQELVTTYLGRPACSDLFAFDGRETVATSNCEDRSVSLYRLVDGRVRHARDLPIEDEAVGFCHGVGFVPPDGRVLCATSLGGGLKVYFLSPGTGELLYSFAEEGWRPKDVAFPRADRMLVASANVAATFEEGDPGAIGSKVSLVALDLDTRSHEVLDELDLPGAATDCVAADGGTVALTDQLNDKVLLCSLEDDTLALEGELPGFSFPHGVDLLPGKGVIAVTSYGDNTVTLSRL